jgi:5-formyltetrahydrofolate cyclo-ligase
MSDASTAKSDARKRAAIVRKSAHDMMGDVAPLLLAALAFPVVPTREQRVLSAFHPYKSEIDTRPLLGRLAGEGWLTCLPIVVAPDKPLMFRRWMPGQPTVAGAMNIPQPTDDAEEVLPHVLLVPMLAFDRQGYRLGYGGGYYDRTLEMLRKKRPVTAIGVAYAAQQVDSVPRDSHDQPLDFVMTEREVFACG